MLPNKYQRDLKTIFQGIEDGVETSGTIGILSVFGSRAFPILVGTSSIDGNKQVIAAAGRLGDGAVVGFAHDCFIKAANPSITSLLNNSISWTLSGRSKERADVAIICSQNSSSLEAWMTTAPFNVHVVKPEDVHESSFKYDAAILGWVNNSTPDFVNFLTSWVRRGGGLVTGVTMWANSKDLTAHPSQLICLEAGFAWTEKYSISPFEGDGGKFRHNFAKLQDTHAGYGWKLLLAEHDGEGNLDAARKSQLQSVLEIAKAALPASHPLKTAIATNSVANYHQKDLAILFAGLESSGIEKAGCVGVMSVYGPDAFPILVGRYTGDDTIGIAGAGARYGNGRLIGYAHDSLTHPKDNHLGPFLTNCVQWVGKAKDNLRVAVLRKNYYVTEWVGENQAKFNFSFYTDSQSLLKDLDALDVILLADIYDLRPEHVPNVQEFIKHGGGLVTSGTAWNATDIDTFIGNLLSRDAGFAYTASTQTVPFSGDAFPANSDKLVDVHAGEAWVLVFAQINGEIKLSPDRLKQLGTIISFAIEVKQSGRFLDTIQADLENSAEIIPSESHEITNPTEKLLLKYRISCLYNTPELKSSRKKRDLGGVGLCHPAAQYFPGLPTGSERTVNQNVNVVMKINAWYSTGLYAPPGEEILVKFDSPVTEKLVIQIGSHSDDISKVDVWKRCPYLITKQTVPENSTSVRASNTFGGLIYVVLKKELATKTSRTVSITGAIPAPRFILGETSLDDWKKARANISVPWGELETTKLIITLPAPRLSGIEDPIELLEHWNKILDSMADLAGISRDRPYPERIVADVEISLGYMHSGYPIMMLKDKSVETAVSVASLRTDMAWGHYHELGHNHQKSTWTFQHTTEVTNNMFVLYVFETVCGLDAIEARPDTFLPTNTKSMLENYAAQGPNYAIWDNEPFTGLLFYYQLKKKYGWNVYKSVFRAYIDQNLAPFSQQEKVDTWFIQFSLKSGENLAPMFKAWGLPISDSAISQVSHLAETQENLFSLIPKYLY